MHLRFGPFRSGYPEVEQGDWMSKRAQIVAAQIVGLGASFAVIWFAMGSSGGFMPINVALTAAFLPSGLVALAMVASVALRRLGDDDVVAGGALKPGSRADTDQRALANTVEQIVVALAVLPFVALALGGFVVIWIGLALAAGRVLYWLGYHLSPAVKSLGFALGLYPTVIALGWSVVNWPF